MTETEEWNKRAEEWKKRQARAWKKYPTRENGALVLHAYVPDYAATDNCYEIACAACGARSEGECYDDRMGKWPRDSITIRAAFAFGDWDRERIPWAW